MDVTQLLRSYDSVLRKALYIIAEESPSFLQEEAAEIIAVVTRWPDRKSIWIESPKTAIPKLSYLVSRPEPDSALMFPQIDRLAILEIIRKWLLANEGHIKRSLVEFFYNEALRFRTEATKEFIILSKKMAHPYKRRFLSLYMDDIVHSLVLLAARALDIADPSKSVFNRVYSLLVRTDHVMPYVFRDGESYAIPSTVWRKWLAGDRETPIDNHNAGIESEAALKASTEISEDDDLFGEYTQAVFSLLSYRRDIVKRLCAKGIVLNVQFKKPQIRPVADFAL